MPVPIDVFFIGRTAVDRGEMMRWLKRVGVSADYKLPPPGEVTDPALLIGVGGKRCYKSFEVEMNPNLSKIRADWGVYLDNVLASGHGSVLEHAVYNFAFEGVSRVFTGEMNRHRAGWAISEGSMRFIRYEDEVPYWEPDAIRGPAVLARPELVTLDEFDFESLHEALEGLNGREKLVLPSVEAKKEATRILLARQFGQQSTWYKCLCSIWKDELAPTSKFGLKKALTSLFRRGIGMGVATGGMWSGNVRGVRHVITMRASPTAEEEILHVFSRVAKRIVEEEPMLFGDFVETDGCWAPKYVKV